MNLQSEYMENSFYSGRKIFRRKWGTDKNKPCGLYSGYYRNEEKTKEVWYDDMYHMGDTSILM